ncbi:MAG: hypothetical protein DWH79_06830 [Planctomycetota bacterium]|nr:MAG: hypothetical protein DWH79_06830 [Planctomycetota bacterium]
MPRVSPRAAGRRRRVGAADPSAGGVGARARRRRRPDPRGGEAPVVRVPLEAAELQKYIHNSFNALKISFFNEMRCVAERMDLKAEVETMFSVTRQSAEGMWNPADGTRDWGPVSGPCLPKDVEAFLGWMRSCDLASPLLESLSASSGNR